MNRYHVVIDDKRTTVSLDKIVSELIALHLGFSPDDDLAHGAVRGWIQQRVDRPGAPRARVSQWLLSEAISVVGSPNLIAARRVWERDLR